MYADAIVLAGHVETFAEERPAGPPANAVAVADGRVVAVGDVEALGPLRGPGTVVHAFPGATVMPGLVDVHAHPVWGSIEAGRGVSLSGAVTLDDVCARLAGAAEGRPPGAWITGFDLDVNVFDGEPSGAVFAERLPGRPVSLMTQDAHALVVSPRVVELVGLTGRETFTTPRPSRSDPTAARPDTWSNSRPCNSSSTTTRTCRWTPRRGTSSHSSTGSRAAD
ncbi:amidohydrolase family protein [Streptomyces sp. DSM 118148]|uniref:amidohydrolase family protein n=1 Tax=Streptomyces sp. DSM 118148 TaxID=3448667 RepID=UPI0040400533